MRNPTLAILAVSLTLALAACSRDDGVDTAATATPAPAPVDQASVPVPDPATPALGSLVVGGDGEGIYLADNSGRALYVLQGDDTGTRCIGDCTREWLVVAGAQPVSGVPAVQGELIGTTTRSDGTTQVTYAGHPLYYFASDTGPGMTHGHDLTDEWGHWVLVRPNGEPMASAATAMGATETGSASDSDAAATGAEPKPDDGY
jgi:predicted lipoprotein with Yx(FWY)xxD motif